MNGDRAAGPGWQNPVAHWRGSLVLLQWNCAGGDSLTQEPAAPPRPAIQATKGGFEMLRQRLVASVLVACALLGCACGGPKDKGASALQVGEPITVTAITPVAKLAAEPVTFAGQQVRIEGTVKAVCQGRGCWVEVTDKEGKSFLARSLDESVLLPKDCAGRKIVVQGVVTALPREAAEEAKAAEAAEGHACPKPDYVVATQGVELR
jgi:hypothetical protein